MGLVIEAILAGQVVSLEGEDDDRELESDYEDSESNTDEDNQDDDGDDVINLSVDIAPNTIGTSDVDLLVLLWMAHHYQSTPMSHVNVSFDVSALSSTVY